MKTKSLIALLFCSFLGVCLLTALGLWQVQRLQWKRSLIERIELRARATMISLDQAMEIWRKKEDIDYTRIALKGRFSHENERHLYAVIEGQSGWRIVTPFELQGGRIALIDRGFVPDHLKAAALRPLGQIEGELSLTGLARKGEGKRPRFVPENDTARNRWFWRDLQGLARSIYGKEAFENNKIDLVPFFVESEDLTLPGGWPRGGVTRLALPNRHLEYALTWFLLAIVLIFMTALFIHQQKKEEHF